MDINKSRKRWETRRKMAWISLITLVMMSAAAFFFNENLDKAEGIINTLIIGFTTIIGSYIGFATLDDKNHIGKDGGEQ
jgi:hypothetical protein